MAASVGRWMAPGRWFGPVGQGIASGATRDHHPRVAGGHPRVAGGHQLRGGWLGRLVVVIGLKTSPKGGTARAEVTSARRNGTPGWRACGTAQNGRDIGLACMRDRSERAGVAGRRPRGTVRNGRGWQGPHWRAGAARTSGSAHLAHSARTRTGAGALRQGIGQAQCAAVVRNGRVATARHGGRGRGCHGSGRNGGLAGPDVTICLLTCMNGAGAGQDHGILTRDLPPFCAQRTRLNRHRQMAF
jgi:hypothetical protein